MKISLDPVLTRVPCAVRAPHHFHFRLYFTNDWCHSINIYSYFVVDGGWTDWSLWSSCSVTCGNGQATRKRFCASPSPANGGLTCPGPSTEQKSCQVANCPGKTKIFVYLGVC